MGVFYGWSFQPAAPTGQSCCGPFSGEPFLPGGENVGAVEGRGGHVQFVDRLPSGPASSVPGRSSGSLLARSHQDQVRHGNNAHARVPFGRPIRCQLCHRHAMSGQIQPGFLGEFSSSRAQGILGRADESAGQRQTAQERLRTTLYPRKYWVPWSGDHLCRP